MRFELLLCWRSFASLSIQILLGPLVAGFHDRKLLLLKRTNKKKNNTEMKPTRTYFWCWHWIRPEIVRIQRIRSRNSMLRIQREQFVQQINCRLAEKRFSLSLNLGKRSCKLTRLPTRKKTTCEKQQRKDEHKEKKKKKKKK
jgi:hypothetical protein